MIRKIAYGAGPAAWLLAMAPVMAAAALWSLLFPLEEDDL